MVFAKFVNRETRGALAFGGAFSVVLIGISLTIFVLMMLRGL